MPKKPNKFKITKAKKQKEQKEQREQEEENNPRFIGNYARSPRRERSPEEKKEYKKLALFLLMWSVFVASVYFAFVRIEDEFLMTVVMIAYLALSVVFFFLWLIFNGGISKFDASEYQKPAEMGYDEFCGFIEKLTERHRKSKYFLAVSVPFIVVMLVDFLMIIWGGD